MLDIAAKLNLSNGYVDGDWLSAGDNKTFAVSNPANGDIIAEVADFGTVETEKAIAAAKNAFVDWSKRTAKQRCDIMKAWFRLIMQNQDQLARLLSQEQGKPFAEAKGEIAYGASYIDWFAEEARRNYGDVVPAAKPDTQILVLKQAIGVVAAITPWNFPNAMIARKVAPALAAGCTIVIKPAPDTPLSALALAQLAEEAGIPKGVVNIIPTTQTEAVGTLLTTHPDVAKVSFTGSTRAGVEVAKNAAPTVKRVAQELGGKSANIILDDANFQKAVAGGVIACMGNSGQSCNAPTRMLVPEARMEEAIAIAKAAVEKVRPGNPSDEATGIGPVVSELQWNKIQGLIEKGVEEGAEIIAGGPGKPEGLEQGYYVKPTIFANVRNNMTIAREEIFGPVLSILPYKDEDDAVAIANDTPYGLAAYVSSGDEAHALKVARRLRAGSVHLNGAGVNFMAPFGGYKMSGNGREWGVLGLEEFLETKAVLRPAK